MSRLLPLYYLFKERGEGVATVDSLNIQITADATSASRAIDNLVVKLDRLSASLGKVNTSSLSNLSKKLSTLGNVNNTSLNNATSSMTNLTRASNAFAVGLNRTRTASQRASKSYKGLVSSIGMFYARFFLAIRGIKALWRSIEGTADYIEAYNYFDVAMGKIGSDWSHQFEKYGYENAEAYADSFKERLADSLKNLSGVSIEINADGSGLLTETGMKNLGLNIQEVTQYASQLASVTNSVGQTGEVSLAAASAFSKLGADMSSLFNMDYSQVMNNLQSGLIGQSRALYRYGIDITNATLQTYAYELGLTKAVSEMTQAEKMQLRMIAILDQSKVSWGDLANTINSPSNMIRQFTNNLKEASMILGQLFIPLLQKVLPFLNGVMVALKRLLVTIASFFGVTIDLEGFGQGFTELEDDIGGVGDSLDDATNSAKKFRKQLAGFDELENLSSETGKSTSGLGGTIDLTNEILKATEEYEKAFAEAMERMENQAQSWADKIVEFFTKGNVAAKISKALTKALNGVDWNSILKTAKNFGKGIANFLNNLITPDLFTSIGRTIGNYWNTIILTMLTFGQDFDWGNLGESLASGINEFFATLDTKKLAETINVWIKGALETVSTFFKKTDFEAIGNKIGEFLKELDFSEILIDIANLIWEALKGGFDLITTVFEEAPLETALIVAFSAVTFTGLGSFIASKIATALAAQLGLAGTYTSVTAALSAGLTKALVSVGGIGGLLTTNVAVIAGAGTLAEIGLTIGAGVIGGVVAAISGWHFGQFLYEKISGEIVDMSWEEQFAEIFKSFEDGTWTDALTLWGKDVVNALTEIGYEQERWVKEIYGRIAEIIADWWTNNVAPWFTKERWAELWEIVKIAASEMWRTFTDWWQNTALGRWWRDNVAPWFTKEKWVSAMDGIVEAFEFTWNNAVSSIKEIWNQFANWLNNMLTWEIEPIEIMGNTIFEGATIELGKIPTFATGGFPEDGLFMANRGELVGQFSNGKTAVANNEQITSGIANAVYPAVYNAVSEAMRGNSNGNSDIRVFIGDREITDVAIDGINDIFMRTGKTPILI